MIELPEALTIAKQLNSAVAGKKVQKCLPPSKTHKFCWFNGNPEDYDDKLSGSRIISAEGFGIFAELSFDNGKKLCINDGVNLRLLPAEEIPKNYQLAILFTDETALVFTVAMYGGIYLHSGDYDNEYYLKSLAYISPFSAEFENLFFDNFKSSKPKLSAKAFLAANQRFPGIGNGVLQDILFMAGIHPKLKLENFDDELLRKLYSTTVSVLGEMTEKGGRDTEKDIFGNAGGYRTKMSKNTLNDPCPICGGIINKETYMGGSVYYCPNCQPEK